MGGKQTRALTVEYREGVSFIFYFSFHGLIIIFKKNCDGERGGRSRIEA